MNNG
jgi:hypothetical protein